MRMERVHQCRSVQVSTLDSGPQQQHTACPSTRLCDRCKRLAEITEGATPYHLMETEAINLDHLVATVFFEFHGSLLLITIPLGEVAEASGGLPSRARVKHGMRP